MLSLRSTTSLKFLKDFTKRPLTTPKENELYPSRSHLRSHDVHRCLLREWVEDYDAEITNETAANVTIIFHDADDRDHMHQEMVFRDVSCRRLPGNKLIVLLPYTKRSCCDDHLGCMYEEIYDD